MTKRVPIGDFHKDILETLAAKTLIQMMGLEDDPGWKQQFFAEHNLGVCVFFYLKKGGGKLKGLIVHCLKEIAHT